MKIAEENLKEHPEAWKGFAPTTSSMFGAIFPSQLIQLRVRTFFIGGACGPHDQVQHCLWKNTHLVYYKRSFWSSFHTMSWKKKHSDPFALLPGCSLGTRRTPMQWLEPCQSTASSCFPERAGTCRSLDSPFFGWAVTMGPSGFPNSCVDVMPGAQKSIAENAACLWISKSWEIVSFRE